MLQNPRALCFSVLLWKAGALVCPPALRQRCPRVQGDRGPGNAGLNRGGQWRPGARAGPADQASSGSLCLTVGSTPRKEGAPKPLSASAWASTTLFLPPQQPPSSWEGWGEKRPQGSGTMWAEELGVLVGGGFTLVHPLPCPNSSIVPLPTSGRPRPTSPLAPPHSCPFPLQTSTQGFVASSVSDTPPGPLVQNRLTCLRTAVVSDAHTHTHTVG